MVSHPPISVLFIARNDVSRLEPLLAYLKRMAHVQVVVEPQLPGDPSAHHVVVVEEPTSHPDNDVILQGFVNTGGGLLGLIGSSQERLPALFGAQPIPAQPATELRVLFQDYDQPVARRLPEALYVQGNYQALVPAHEGVRTVLYADWHYGHSPVFVDREVGKGRAACTTLRAWDNPGLQQLIYRMLLKLGGRPPAARELGVGLLGYPPSVGQIHGLGSEATPGLALRAVCDLNPARQTKAHEDFPGVTVHDSAGCLGDDPGVDLVVVATPPNTHAQLALQMMTAGKHVVSEKPLALTRAETEAMAEMAMRQEVHLSCYQNRRWDVDYLAIKQTVDEGLIGDLFHLETFVGGFDHPCGYWHSDAAVSGGAAYDWGGHYLDWVVSLIRDPVTEVIGTAHKRVWHDVTNADHERIQIRFVGGQEAEFTHSDIAAVRKPKWYLLGTEGAIIGHWQDVSAYVTEPVLYFHRHDIPSTEMPPDLTLYRRHRSGQIASQQLVVPERRHHQFHCNLADHLLTGEPITAPLEDSMQVVAILEAAKRSASKGGTIEAIDV
jgi:predicted dehydrogenase